MATNCLIFRTTRHGAVRAGRDGNGLQNLCNATVGCVPEVLVATSYALQSDGAGTDAGDGQRAVAAARKVISPSSARGTYFAAASGAIAITFVSASASPRASAAS
jgi:hypothetical protein